MISVNVPISVWTRTATRIITYFRSSKNLWVRKIPCFFGWHNWEYNSGSIKQSEDGKFMVSCTSLNCKYHKDKHMLITSSNKTKAEIQYFTRSKNEFKKI